MSFTTSIAAQDEAELTPMQRIELMDYVQDYVDNMNSLTSQLSLTQTQQIQSVERMANTLDIKWQAWFATNQELLSLDDSIMNLVAQYEQTKTMVMDSIAARLKFIEGIDKFRAAEKFILSNDSVYKKLEKQAFRLSMVEKLAPRLDKLKAREQLLIASIQTNYDTAKEIAAIAPQLAKRMNNIDEVFFEIKASSGRIQAMAYKPLIQRIKDYVMSLAAFSIIMMFITYIAARIKAFNKAKKAAKEMRKLMERQNEEYPTI